MAQPFIQSSIASGEFSPQLYARTDIKKYHDSAAYLRNWFIDVRGGASTRPGQAWVGPCADQVNRSRLFPFQFSITQAYTLCFGNYVMQVIKNGELVLNAGLPITGITNASPGVITVNGSAPANGTQIFIQNVQGMSQINGIWFLVAGSSGSTFTLTDLFGNAINTTNFAVYLSGGTASSVYVLTTPYAAADLPLLKYTQQNDVMTLTHPNYTPNYLTRLADNNWTITAITYAAKQPAPSSVTCIPSTTGTTTYYYVVTAINGSTEEESLQSIAGSAASVTMSQTAGSSIAVTWNTATPIPAGSISQYKVYRTQEVPASAPPAGSLYGFVGTSTGTGFTDVNIAPDFSNTPPQGTNPFSSGNNPGCATYFQERQVFAASTSDPETIWFSQPGNYNNFDTHLPTVDSDAITASIVSNQLNPIKFMVPLNSLLALSATGVWQLSGNGQAGVGITPSNITAQPQAYNGCADVQPIPINYDVLYVQEKGSVPRDLNYNFYVNLYTGTDMSVFSKHLFFGHQIQEWAWSEEPFKTIWSVREDGMLLSFVYLKEQDIYGWAHHDTGQQMVTWNARMAPAGPIVASATAGQDNYRSVVSIPEVTNTIDTPNVFADAVYFVVQRNINGNTLWCIERQDNRLFYGDVRLAWCVDCGLQYPLTFPNATLSLSFQTAGSANSYILNASMPIFSSYMAQTPSTPGYAIRANNGVFVVTQYNSATQVIASPIRQPVYDLEASPDAPPLINLSPAVSGDWTCTAPVSQVTGLNHLEGMSVAILADGGVQAQRTVVAGTITLDAPATDIIVGLPFQAQLQSMYIDTGEPTIQTKLKSISDIFARVVNTRGLKAGPNFQNLVDIKERTTQPYGTPVELITGDEGPIYLPSSYNHHGQVCFQQDYPLPATIAGFISYLNVEGSK